MTKLVMLDMVKEFDPNKVVRNSNPINKGEFTQDGIFSEEIFGPESEINNIDSIAWIDLGEDNYIMPPLMYHRVAKLIKAKYLDSIIQYNKRIDADGNLTNEPDDDGRTAKIDDANIGLYNFKKDFVYILNKYTPIKKKRDPEYRNLLKWYLEGKVFINKVPIFSPKLRPAQIFKDDKTFQFSEINNYYNFIISHSNSLKVIYGDNSFSDVVLQKAKILYKIQTYMLKVGDSIIELIKNKRGTIRKIILAGRVNFSARNVIVPNPDLKTNEVILNYVTFVELYKIPLINLISLSEGISYVEAQRYVDQAQLSYDDKLYGYINELLSKTKGGVRVMINRNPSISVHSIAIVKVKAVTNDPHDYTMQLSNNILSGMGADFDGDVLNIIALFSREQYENFKMLDPMYQIISPNDGNFNRTFTITKDAKLAAYLLANTKKDNEVTVVD